MTGGRGAQVPGRGVDPDVERLLDVALPAVLRRLPSPVRERYREEWSADILGAVELDLDPRDVLAGARTAVRRYWLRRAGDVATGREGWWVWLVLGPALLASIVYALVLFAPAVWFGVVQPEPSVRGWAEPLLEASAWMVQVTFAMLLVGPWRVRPARTWLVGLAGLLGLKAIEIYLTLWVRYPGHLSLRGIDDVMRFGCLLTLAVVVLACRQVVVEHRAARRGPEAA